MLFIYLQRVLNWSRFPCFAAKYALWASPHGTVTSGSQLQLHKYLMNIPWPLTGDIWPVPFIYILRSNKVLGWSPFQEICSISNTSHERVPIWNALRQAFFWWAVVHLINSARLFSHHTLSLASQMVVWMLGEVSLDLHFQVEQKFGDMYLNSIIYITFYHYIDISDTIVLLCIAEST